MLRRALSYLTCLLCCVTLTTTASADFSATAGIVGSKNASYTESDQPSRLAAAYAAQQACLAKHPVQPTDGAHCELTHVDGKPIVTSEDIKARLPNEPHPLFLWRFKSSTSTVYLAGSVHLLKPGLYPLAAPYDAAFAESDYLVVEVDSSRLSADQVQRISQSYILLPESQQLSDVLPAPLYAELDEVTREFGSPLNNQAKPAFVTQQLAVLALISAGYDPAQGVEAYFTQRAQTKELLELESLEFQLNLVMNQDLATQIQMAEDTLEQIDDFQVIAADMITAWLAGDDQAFLAAFSAQSGDSPTSQAFMRQLMDDRNVGMAEKVKGYLTEGKGTYFVLAGAAHFVGNNGIIELLAREDIRGTRIQSNDHL